MNILITGIPGSGKSAVHDELVKQGYSSFSIEDMEGFCAMYDKKTGEKVEHDNESLEECKQHDWNCDINKLKNFMKKQTGTVFYEAVLSNFDELIPLFDKVFLLKISPKVLCQRLTDRTSNDFGRTKEVQDWVLEWKDKWESKMIKKGVIEIDATQKIEKVVDDILDKINSN